MHGKIFSGQRTIYAPFSRILAIIMILGITMICSIAYSEEGTGNPTSQELQIRAIDTVKSLGAAELAFQSQQPEKNFGTLEELQSVLSVARGFSLDPNDRMPIIPGFRLVLFTTPDPYLDIPLSERAYPERLHARFLALAAPIDNNGHLKPVMIDQEQIPWALVGKDWVSPLPSGWEQVILAEAAAYKESGHYLPREQLEINSPRHLVGEVFAGKDIYILRNETYQFDLSTGSYNVFCTIYVGTPDGKEWQGSYDCVPIPDVFGEDFLAKPSQSE